LLQKYCRNSNIKSGVFDKQQEIVPIVIASTTDNRKWQYCCFGRQLPFAAVRRCRKDLATRRARQVTDPEFAVGISKLVAEK